MENTTIIEKLSMFGLSRQEAILYRCLLSNEEITGYEVSKLTGISRSNVYNGLASLVENGAAYILEGSANKYVAVSIEEFCNNKLRLYKETAEYLKENCPKKTKTCDGYITIEGYSHIRDKIYNMLMSTEKRVYFSASAQFLNLWENELQNLAEKGCKIVLISPDSDIFSNNPKLKEKVTIYQLPPSLDRDGFLNRAKQIRLIIDSEFVLTGEVEKTEKDACLYSAQKNFVNVFKEAIRNEMELINIYSNNTK